mmetsp:Transcript_62725/g.168587  ORF Transcript_62725/g.168587 Transcript_62725/m.168587 type:complete len:362 (-) Transcript_62725:769-1854(-)
MAATMVPLGGAGAKLVAVLEDPSSRQFLILSTVFIVMMGLSCYVEEWIFKELPGFDFYWTVTFVELVCFTLGAQLQRRAFDGDGKSRSAPLHLYIVTAVCLAVSQALGKVAYRYMNYATGTIVKSAKLIPTMALSILWLRREVPLAKWIAAGLLVASASFMALGESSVDLSFNPVGLVFSAAHLSLAALQGNLQEVILKDHGASIGEAMFYINGLGMFVVLVVMAAIGELVPATAYFLNSPRALLLLGIRSVTFYFGGIASNKLTKEFGTIALTTVGTARKTLTVLLSFLLFPKPLHINYAYGVTCFLAAEVVYLVLTMESVGAAQSQKAQASVGDDYEMVGKAAIGVPSADDKDDDGGSA